MKLIGILGLLLILASIYNYTQISQFSTNKLTLHSEKLSYPLRITQISDYHSNGLINRKNLLDEISHFNPNIIVLTGDIIDRKTNDINSVLNLVEEFVALSPNVFFVIGNHELKNKNGNKFIEKMKELGVIILDDDIKTIQIGEDIIDICGISFFATEEDYEGIIKDINQNNFIILLSHSPNRIIHYSKGVEDLILTGHTHGGQIRLPLLGSIIAPGQGLFPKYDKGLFQLKGTPLYIDSGLGNSTIPVRLFNRVQISNITIKPTRDR